MRSFKNLLRLYCICLYVLFIIFQMNILFLRLYLLCCKKVYQQRNKCGVYIKNAVIICYMCVNIAEKVFPPGIGPGFTA